MSRPFARSTLQVAGATREGDNEWRPGLCQRARSRVPCAVVHAMNSALLASLLTHPRYEIVPLAGAEEAVLEHVPPGIKVTVTTSPRKGLEPTLALVERLAARGYDLVPHLAARHVRDPGHLSELVERLRGVGVGEILVMTGDAPEPAGEFDGSLPVLHALADLGAPFAEVGVTGYPESNSHMTSEGAMRLLKEKEPHATYVVSQISFDVRAIVRWVRSFRERRSRLNIRVGIPGPVDRDRLLRISERIGVGDSIGVLRAAGGATFDPTQLVSDLAAVLDEDSNVVGVHVFTFNELEATERWRREHLELARAPS